MAGYRVKAETPDFSAYPDLVVMILGMRAKSFRGALTILKIGPPIDRAGGNGPEGLLRYENNIIFQFFPLHAGMRWYWRDLQSMETWARSEPHRAWWARFSRDTGGTEFWHETYHKRGGMQAIYFDMREPFGLSAFLPMVPARGTIGSRVRAQSATELAALAASEAPE
ncbi:monooxygenase family protein [Methylobacterium iners]|uniref:DUF4188 domain-containing protein n=1 Tax=Methylobacterium iners TaxID=418707 RepID=A0ABQ4RWZ6_9HYPH|nr:DUF4188 domain-containing protein [Methylobacterium iners]GJD94759.1 hypothetical protein OCOJLMKI_1963 [Methylobacterium iners]